MLSDRAPAERSERVLVTGVDRLAAARRLARAVAVSVLGGPRADDVALVASELVTNALEHGSGGPVEVLAISGPDGVEVSVSSPSPELPVRPSVQPAPVTDVRGRGLQIVASLADSVVVVGDGGDVRVTCRFER